MLDAASLLGSGAADPDFWDEDAVWQAFSGILDREGPLPGLGGQLQSYRAVFADVFRQVSYEHGFLLGRYFRTSDKRPIVNPTNIEHLTRLLHYFTQGVAAAGAQPRLLDCLFYVLKGRCNLNLFYYQKIEPFFFAFHALGAVLGYGHYGRFLIVHQGCTIGENNGRYPEIGAGCVVGPQSMILGQCRIGRNVRFAAGSMVIDRNIPDDTIVFGRTPDIKLKPNPIDNRSLWFDMSALAQAGEL